MEMSQYGYGVMLPCAILSIGTLTWEEAITFHMEGDNPSVLYQEKAGYLWWFGLWGYNAYEKHFLLYF